MIQQVHILVNGRVQGVAFRAYTRSEADRLMLKGYVRNLADGRVEILAEGEREVLDKLVEWAHVGPPVAIVDEVVTKFSEASGGYGDFQVRY